MARTAPIPNFPAIPGMNPGLFLMGGGGDGGGSGAGKGKGKGGKQRAGGKNGGKDAGGGGKGAGNCGAGSGGGCMNPSHGNRGTHAGDPVDPATGRVYTIPQTDMVLLGPLAMPLRRAYSSFDVGDRGLGVGWSTSLDWSITTRRRTMTVHRPFGAQDVCTLPEEGEVIPISDGAFVRRERGAMVVSHRFQLLVLTPSPVDPSLFRLSRIQDEAGNAITLAYDDVGLSQVVDSAGRTISVRRHPSGRISHYELRTRAGRPVWYRRYEHDSLGNLIATVDAEGRRITYSYDEEHRLVEQRYASGLRVCYAYDGAGRCVESFCVNEGDDRALAPDAPAVLADGVTPARGFLHVRLEYGPDFTLVYDSRQVRRFDLAAGADIERAAGLWVEEVQMNERGEMVAYEGPTGARTQLERDARGRVTAVVDAEGHRTEMGYDEMGNLVRLVDAMGALTTYEHDGAQNLLAVRDALGELLSFSYDRRGLRTEARTPDGARTHFEYDAEGHLIGIREPNGKARRLVRDDTGQVVEMADEEGHSTRFVHDGMGALRRVELPNGTSASFDRDADGRIQRYIGPDGAVFTVEWGGHDVAHTLGLPNGERVELRYDREGALVSVRSPAGEVAAFERDVAGRVVRETRFDGRELVYKLDSAGRLTRITSGAGEQTAIEHTPEGRVAKRSYGDAAFDAFEYDAVGRLVSAETESTRAELGYDTRGNLVAEALAAGGQTRLVSSAYDAAGRCTALQITGAGLSTSYGVKLGRDAMGLVTRIELDDGSAVERTFDGLGREVLRTLPGGGAIVCRYDALGGLLERRVTGPAGAVRGPAWTGALPPGTHYAEGFVATATGGILEHSDTSGVVTRFSHDALGRIVGLQATDGRQEEYIYGAGGRLFERGASARPRTYGAGGALLSCGSVSFEYDAEARRIARSSGDGRRDRYEWDARGLLSRVVLASGTVVHHEYDAFARRTRKLVEEPGGAQRETVFVWSEDFLVGERTDEIRDGRRRRVMERFYVVDEGRGETLLHVQIDGGDPSTRRTVHYVLGPGDMPVALLRDDGSPVARFRPTLWGKLEEGAAAATSVRFLGQYEDEETGLHYNRNRFYDPDTGLYLSADPLGLGGGLNAFEYARGEPWRNVDPLGLIPMRAVVQGAGITRQGLSASGRQGEPNIHPIVQQSFPPGVAGTDAQGNPATFYPQGQRTPDNCAEPVALSNYIREWERRHNGGRPLDPNNPRDAAQIRRCMRSIDSIRSTDDGNGDERRAPCPNCSQLIQNLNARWGGPRARTVAKGASAPGKGDSTRFTPPRDPWAAAMGM